MNAFSIPKGNNTKVIRLTDITLSLIGIITTFPFIFLIMIVIVIADRHTPIFTQERLGKEKEKFKIIKLRTMSSNAPNVPAHEAKKEHITKMGAFLRKYKIDELPQLINVLRGDMSLVGPRPSLLNEHQVIAEREKRDIYHFRPGITGLAAIKKVDMSRPKFVARLDLLTMNSLDICLYFSLILKTLLGKGIHDPATQAKNLHHSPLESSNNT